MIRKEKRAGKKYWILTVFAAFIAIAMSFVSWLIYAVFSQSYREIKQQYYGVVSRQIVEDIENSIRNGKQIERFYGMDKVLSDMLAIISTDQVPVNTAITDVSGNILYSSYSGSGSEAEYVALLQNESVIYNYLGGILEAVRRAGDPVLADRRADDDTSLQIKREAVPAGNSGDISGGVHAVRA